MIILSYPFGKILSLASVVRTAEKLNSNNERYLELSVLYKKLPDDLKEQIINPYVLIDKTRLGLPEIIDTHQN